MQNQWGDTALIEACGEGYVMIAALLIKKRAMVNYQNKVKSTKVNVVVGCTRQRLQYVATI